MTITERTDNPRFSIIIPVYNVEKYIAECLDSIINQTFKDFEVICINDGSLDGSLGILNSYAEKDNRFTVVTQENQGQGVARNNGLKKAKGEYILFVDPDDWIELDALEQINNAFLSTNAEILMFNNKTYYEHSGKFTMHSIEDNFIKLNYNLKDNPYFNRNKIQKGCLFLLPSAAWNKAYSLDLIRRINAEFPPTKYLEDHIFFFMILLHAKKIYYLNEYVYIYRIRKNSATNSYSEYYYDVFYNLDILKKYLIEHNFYDEYKNDFEEYKLSALGWAYDIVAPENRQKYESMCKEILSEQSYKEMVRRSKIKKTFLEQIFSIRNVKKLGVKYKIITIFGMEIKLTLK